MNEFKRREKPELAGEPGCGQEPRRQHDGRPYDRRKTDPGRSDGRNVSGGNVPGLNDAMSTSPPAPIRVMVVDDHAVVRSGLAAFLLATEDLELVGEAASGADAVRLCGTCRPDVVLVDLVMPGMDGAQTTRAIRPARRKTPHPPRVNSADAPGAARGRPGYNSDAEYRDLNRRRSAVSVRPACFSLKESGQSTPPAPLSEAVLSFPGRCGGGRPSPRSYPGRRAR